MSLLAYTWISTKKMPVAKYRRASEVRGIIVHSREVSRDDLLWVILSYYFQYSVSYMITKTT